MSDLDGMDAFTEVLDRLSRSEARVAELQERLSVADTAARQAKNDGDQVLGVAQEMVNRAKKGLPALKELWEAAEAIQKSITTEDERFTRLRRALALANGYCDQPPV